jgi:hypothetical protein
VKYKLPGRHDWNINIMDLTLDDLQGEEGGGGRVNGKDLKPEGQLVNS